MKRLARLREGRSSDHGERGRVGDRGVAFLPSHAAEREAGATPHSMTQKPRSRDRSDSGAVALMLSFVVGYLGAMVVDWLRSAPPVVEPTAVSERADADVQVFDPAVGSPDGESSEQLDEAWPGAADLPAWSTAPQAWGR